jgi:hypothetical protein
MNRSQAPWLLLLIAGCVPIPDPTAPAAIHYVPTPLAPGNCGTPDQPISCKGTTETGLPMRTRGKQQREQEPRIIWEPEPFYVIIKEPLPDLTPLTRLY